MKAYKFSAFIVCLLFVLSACAPATPPPAGEAAPPTTAAAPPTTATATEQAVAAEATPTPQPLGLLPDAPQYGKHGPFWVGYKPLVIGEGTDRKLDVSLWYPALNPDGAKEEITYTITPKNPARPSDRPAFVRGHALENAAIDRSGAPYPLVVFSPGFSGNAASYGTSLEHYASLGFVVLAPEHIEKWDPEFGDLWKASIDRPRDITQTLDYAEQLTAPGGDMAGLIDMKHVAVVGHSYGGYTALAMAGAQYDLDAYNARCAQLPPGDPLASLCTPLVPKEADMAARAGLDPMPQGLWPSFGDPRVTAIIPMAGDSYPFDKAGLSKITIPMMAIGGTADTGTPYEWGSKPSYEYASSPRKALVTFKGAEHMIFNTPCENEVSISSENPFYGFVCFDPTWDKYRALDLINHLSTAFLLAELKGDAEAAAALAPENVSFPGIQYETTGYGAAPTPAAGLDAETVAKIEALVETTMAENKIPGFAIGIVKDGRIVYTKGFGVAELDGGEPVTSRTLFQLAETSMMPTAIAILQLVDLGKLDLDAPVTDYLPYFRMKDERSQDITVGHLLLSRSGMRDLGDSYDSAMADWDTFVPQHDAGAAERWVRSLSDEQLLFAPGTSFGYSDQGYGLLGDVIAKAGGQSYEDYVRENIFAPLDMEASTFLLEEVDRGMLASPHTSDAAGKVVASEKLPYHRPFAAANNLFSNVEEMARLVMASMNGGILEGTSILPEEAVKQMWTTHSATTFGEYPFGKVYPARLMQGWGYGWFIGDVQGQTAYTAFGNEHGYHSTISVVPDANVAVIAMGNGPRTSGLYATDIAADVTGMLLQASGNAK